MWQIVGQGAHDQGSRDLSVRLPPTAGLFMWVRYRSHTDAAVRASANLSRPRPGATSPKLPLRTSAVSAVDAGSSALHSSSLRWK